MNNNVEFPENTKNFNVGFNDAQVIHGKDGISPIVTAEETDDGVKITITDINGTSTATVRNGQDGINGTDGKDGQNGKDGVSATHFWNGTTLTVTSASGTTSADLKGEKGERGEKGEQGPQGEKGEKGEKGDSGKVGATGADGYTPVKGEDYWTPEDISEIKSYVDEAILGGAW